jgi:hypothetical protein
MREAGESVPVIHPYEPMGDSGQRRVNLEV